MDLIGYIFTSVAAAFATCLAPLGATTAPEPEVVYVETEPQVIYVEAEPQGIYADCGLILDEIQESPEGYLITITMQNGNKFAFVSEDGDLETGEIISAVFKDNGTDEVSDDEIISYRYSGWVSDDEMEIWVK